MAESSWHIRISDEIDRYRHRLDCNDAEKIRGKLEYLKALAGKITEHSKSCRQCRKYFTKINELAGMLDEFVNEPYEYTDGFYRIIDEISFHLQKDHQYTVSNTYVRICTIFGGLIGISGGGALGQSLGSLIFGLVVGVILGTVSGFFIGRMIESKLDSEGKLL